MEITLWRDVFLRVADQRLCVTSSREGVCRISSRHSGCYSFALGRRTFLRPSLYHSLCAPSRDEGPQTTHRGVHNEQAR